MVLRFPPPRESLLRNEPEPALAPGPGPGRGPAPGFIKLLTAAADGCDWVDNSPTVAVRCNVRRQ